MSSTSNSDSSKKAKSAKPKTNEEILSGFQKLRNEQRFLSNKLNELELDLHEHKLVIDTLKEVDGDRKCFRMIGGILCERTVKDVLPILKTNEENLVKFVESLNQQMVTKGTEINKYKEEHNLKFKHVDELNDGYESVGKSINSGVPSPEGDADLLSMDVSKFLYKPN